MAAGEPDKVETGQGGQYFWIFKRSNDKLLYVEFDGSGMVKKTSVKDMNEGGGKKKKKKPQPVKGWMGGKADPLAD